MRDVASEIASVTPSSVERAARDLAAHLPPTPLQYSRAFTDKVRCHVHIKVESIQPIRAFKVRGALTKIMRLLPEKSRAGVVTASAGNHGQGVAYAAAVFKIPATVYVPETANQLKVEAIKRLGAKVVLAGRNYHDAYLEAMRQQAEGGATFVHAFDDPDVIAGQGSIAVELLRDLEDFDTVLVPIGGGGLIGGISLYIKEMLPHVRVIGVEPSGADGMSRSLQAGRVVTLDQPPEVVSLSRWECILKIEMLFSDAEKWPETLAYQTRDQDSPWAELQAPLLAELDALIKRDFFKKGNGCPRCN